MSDFAEPDTHWGEQRERRRRWRKLALLALICLLAGLGALVLPISADGNGVFDHHPSRLSAAIPPVARVTAGLVLLLVLILFARLNWLSSDELRRAQVKDFWAAIGFSMLVAFPLVHVLGPYTTAGTRLALTYGAGLAGGCIRYLWRTVSERIGRSGQG